MFEYDYPRIKRLEDNIIHKMDDLNVVELGEDVGQLGFFIKQLNMIETQVHEMEKKYKNLIFLSYSHARR